MPQSTNSETINPQAKNSCWEASERHSSDGDYRVVEKAQTNAVVVRLKGGDPFVFGRGGERWKSSKSWGIGRSGASDVWNPACRIPFNTSDTVPRLRLSQVTRQLEVSTDCEMAGDRPRIRNNCDLHGIHNLPC